MSTPCLSAGSAGQLPQYWGVWRLCLCWPKGVLLMAHDVSLPSCSFNGCGLTFAGQASTLTLRCHHKFRSHENLHGPCLAAIGKQHCGKSATLAPTYGAALASRLIALVLRVCSLMGCVATSVSDASPISFFSLSTGLTHGCCAPVCCKHLCQKWGCHHPPLTVY